MAKGVITIPSVVAMGIRYDDAPITHMAMRSYDFLAFSTSCYCDPPYKRIVLCAITIFSVLSKSFLYRIRLKTRGAMRNFFISAVANDLRYVSPKTHSAICNCDFLV